MAHSFGLVNSTTGVIKTVVINNQGQIKNLRITPS